MPIRQLTAADAEVYRALRLRGLREHPDAFGASYEHEAAMPIERFATRLGGGPGPDAHQVAAFGAFADGALVGTAAGYRNDGAKERHKAYLVAVYVAPEARGRGLARALTTAVLERVRTWPGVEQVHLSVAVPNPPARHLYESLGFRTYGVEPRALKLPDRYVDEELMALVLG